VAVCMRFVQRFEASQREAFLKWEQQFIALEESGALPLGERLLPLSAKEPGNTLIWQKKFETLAEAEQALKSMENHLEHTRLYLAQSPLIQESWVEFYTVLESESGSI
jgi:hypothetical protein